MMRNFSCVSDAVKAQGVRELSITLQGVPFPFRWRRTGHEKIVVFTPGAVDRSRSMPVYQRSSYFAEFPYNGVSLFDPTLLLSDELTIGWFQGTPEIYYGDLIGQLVAALLSELRLDPENLIVFGTSAGGIPAMRIGAANPGCTVYCGNIQTDVRRYYPRHLKALMQASYPNTPDANEQFGGRLSILESAGEFNLIMTQNILDTFHYERHFLPFVQSSHHWSKRAQYYTYENEQTLHGPLGKQIEVAIIEAIAGGHDLSVAYEGFRRYYVPTEKKSD